MRFDAALEREFRGALTQMVGPRLRVAIPMAMLAVLAILSLDAAQAQPLMTATVSTLVASLLVPLSVMAVWFYAPAGAWVYRPRALFLLVLTINFILAAGVHIARRDLPEFPYEPYLMAGLFSYFLSGLTFWWAVGAGLVAISCFLMSSMLLGSISAYELYFLSLFHLSGVAGLYFYEHQQRQSFLLARELRWKADIDPLSGLMNHGAVKQHMRRTWAQSIREQKSFGVLMFDIDHFKRINDRCGHAVGDRVVHAMGTVLQDGMRRPLDAAGRLGGDEFVAVWFDVEPDWLVLQSARIRQQLASVVGPLGQDALRVTLSVGGVCVQSAQGWHLDRVLQHADSMLYQVKRDGRDGQRIADQLGGQNWEAEGPKVSETRAHG